MDTLQRYLELRRGMLMVGQVTIEQLYEAYRRFAEKRDGFALTYEAVYPHLVQEIWQIRIWWESLATFRAEQFWSNEVN